MGESKATGTPEADTDDKQARPTGGTHDKTGKPSTQARPIGETHGQILPEDSTGTRNTHPVREDDKDSGEARSCNNEISGRDEENSGRGPPLDATKREGGTATSRDAGSGDGSSISEESPSSKDTTPPIVVLLVPGTGWRHNRSREANLKKKRAETKEPKTTGATKSAIQTPA